MQKITAIKHEETTGKVKELLDGVNAKLGFVPNMMATMASSPAVLEGYLNLSGALGTSLNAKLREQIALTVAEINGCQYCASAHSAIGKMVGLDGVAIEAARQAISSDAKTDAGLKFAKALVISRGKVTESEIEAVKSAGFSEREISEIVANVALNIFTNYFNETAKTVVDFPAVEFPLIIKSANA
ncbi:MAG TPA: carboxymuconolactone decarboxylase family protein [Pyrinomonadaceae bacterium]|nr:carboxymuconolactone decarboxylase family protein [Pyrinomonadaceae bacterium]